MELNHQIEKFIEHFEYNNIEVDGHHHIQAIPWIYKFLIDHKEIQIENIRIPSEKIVLLDFKCLFNLTFYRNLVAVLILKLLCLRKKRYAKKGFAGLLYSGIYNLNSLKLDGPDRVPLLFRQMLTKRLMYKGFIVFNHYDQRQESIEQLSSWIREGKLKYKEDFIEGLENASKAFIGLLNGKNFGKLVVKINDDPTH